MLKSMLKNMLLVYIPCIVACDGFGMPIFGATAVAMGMFLLCMFFDGECARLDRELKEGLERVEAKYAEINRLKLELSEIEIARLTAKQS